MTTSVDLKEFLTGFLAEADEHITAANANLLLVEQARREGESSPRAVRELFRSLHTIKGLSAMVGVEPIVDIAHAMETVLRRADSTGGQLPPAALEALVKGLQAIDERVRVLDHGGAPKPASKALLDAFVALEFEVAEGTEASDTTFDIDPALLAKLDPTEKEQFRIAAVAGKRVVRVDFTPSPSRSDSLTITSVRERVSRVAEIVRVLPIAVAESESAPGGLSFMLFLTTSATDDAIAEAAGTTPDAVVSIFRAKEGSALPAAPDAEAEDLDATDGPRGSFVRVDVSRLDDSLETLSALVVTRFKLARAVSELSSRGIDVRELSTIVHENGRQLRELRAAIMRMRMVRVRSLLERTPLLVRGLSRATSKAVLLELDTGDAEVDKGVGERIFPAIVHLLRNAVDHGIESPVERRAAGKPEQGVLRIGCFQRSNSQLELTISDDGRGMNREEVARRASAPVPQTDRDLLELITRSGVSTATRLTTTSGRGLGMDIVKRIVVSDLGGELVLQTSEGRGTTFKLRIPLTITIVDAFSFMCGGERFVTPVDSIEEIVEVDPGRVVHAPRTMRGGGANLLERRGEALPLFALDSAIGLSNAGEANVSTKALIVRRHAKLLAFEVDRMLGQQEIVVRPLADPLVRVTGISGATDLGDGKPTLVLDLVALGGALLTSAEAPS